MRIFTAVLIAAAILMPITAGAEAVLEDTPQASYERAAAQAKEKRTLTNPRVDGNNSFRNDPQVTATNFTREIGAAVSADVEIFEAP